ncbi:MAG: 2-amino-4-hydroxy-6-hydroxymethyldihydropteridine diphosphokinase [Eubacteriales bacterium]
MHNVFLSLGSNLGDKKQNMDKAILLLKDCSHIHVKKVSSYYETEPVGYTQQDWFLNSVVQIATTLEPYPLLEYCHYIEQQLKRERKIHWGPRTIDVDILLFDDLVHSDGALILPHPRMQERAFVLIPLLEISPELDILGVPIEKILEQFKGEKIRKLVE